MRLNIRKETAEQLEKEIIIAHRLNNQFPVFYITN